VIAIYNLNSLILIYTSKIKNIRFFTAYWFFESTLKYF